MWLEALSILILTKSKNHFCKIMGIEPFSILMLVHSKTIFF